MRPSRQGPSFTFGRESAATEAALRLSGYSTPRRPATSPRHSVAPSCYTGGPATASLPRRSPPCGSPSGARPSRSSGVRRVKCKFGALERATRLTLPRLCTGRAHYAALATLRHPGFAAIQPSTSMCCRSSRCDSPCGGSETVHCRRRVRSGRLVFVSWRAFSNSFLRFLSTDWRRSRSCVDPSLRPSWRSRLSRSSTPRGSASLRRHRPASWSRSRRRNHGS